MFKGLDYLKSGNPKQRHAYQAIEDCGIFREMAAYTPVLCGSLPIAVDVAGSDLDIIMEVTDFGKFQHEAARLYGHCRDFQVKEKIVRGTPSVKANFDYRGFQFECFGQPVAVERQYAYRHMLVEHDLLAANPGMRNEVIRLKERGIKTEPAFAMILQLEGDPYEALLMLERGQKFGAEEK